MYRVTAVYVVGAFAVLEIIDTVIPSTSLPAWGDELFLGIAIVGFPLALVLAWGLVLTKGLQLQFAIDIFKQTDKLLSAHLDFLMMTMLLFGFYCVRAPLPAIAIYGMAIGSITNPGCFLIESLYTAHPPEWYMTFAMASVTVTTIGYATGAIAIARWTLREPAT